jgi:hypothetical protein
MSLLTAAQNPLCHNQASFVRYLDIGILADRLNMNSLKSWAQSQLRHFLELTEQAWVSKSTWDKQLLLEIAAFGKSSPEDIDNGIQTLLRAILTPSSVLTPPYLETCVSLYKDSTFSKTSDALSGWIFVFILSLGHRSSVWLNDLTRDDRLVLLTAQAELTNLSQRSDLRINWLTEKRGELGPFNLCCGNCSHFWNPMWVSNYGKVGKLNSATPLEDIRQIMRLGDYRQTFAWAISSGTWPCQEECGKKVLRSVDERTNLLFQDFDKLHTYFVKYVPIHLV